ncbi:MAG: hypothetical protein RL472_85 [Pseudomonadota bacterium]|jgi:AcrR family transcriptional regulator
MARPKLQDDTKILAHLMAALAESGEKALTFGAISQRCGLAPATLSQRFGSVEGMIRAAGCAEWARLTVALHDAEDDALASAKGVQALLKHLPIPGAQLLALSLRDAELTKAAETWRSEVEAALAKRRGGGAKGRDAAALIFAAWQGRALWEAAGGKSFRLSDLMKVMP